MKMKLLNGVKKADIPELKENFIKAQKFRKHLTTVLEREINSLRTAMRNEEIIDNPNWPILQADRLAQEKAMLRVISWLEDEKN